MNKAVTLTFAMGTGKMKKKELKKAMKKLEKLIKKDMKAIGKLEDKMAPLERRVAMRREVIGRLNYQLQEKKEKKVKMAVNLLIDLYPVMFDG